MIKLTKFFLKASFKSKVFILFVFTISSNNPFLIHKILKNNICYEHFVVDLFLISLFCC